MTQWWVLLQREWLEMWRSYKLIWLPLVFIFLGASQPLTMYYLPDILKNFGELPEGTVIDIPIPEGSEVLASTLTSQFSQVGMLILVLAMMGVIASERVSGVASIVFTKPISYGVYLFSKWLGAVCLTWLSYGLGYVTAWYYTVDLFGPLPVAKLFQTFFVFGLWLTFVVTVTIFCSALLKNVGAVASVALVTVMLILIATSFLPTWLGWSPASHVNRSVSLLMEGETGEQFWVAVVATLASIGIMLVLAVAVLKRKELRE